MCLKTTQTRNDRVILFAASPGTITGLVTLAVAHSKLDLPVTALVAVAVAAVVMWIAMELAGKLAQEAAVPGWHRLHCAAPCLTTTQFERHFVGMPAAFDRRRRAARPNNRHKWP